MVLINIQKITNLHNKNPYFILFFVELHDHFQSFGFGREKDYQYDEYFVFEQADLSSNYFARISKVHFELKRFSPYNDPRYKLLPIVILVKGRNGLYVNGIKLNVGEKMILRDGDVIKLSKHSPLFRLLYKKSPAQLPVCNALNAYYIGDSIGSGGHGHVYIAYDINQNKDGSFSTYALKNIRKRQVTGLSDMDSFNEKLMREVDIMKRMKNPHVMELVEYANTPSHLFILIPMMFGGDLLHRILEQRRLSESDSKYFLLQLLQGLNYMHNKGIAHRDIKCENLLLSDHGPSPILKISDFGLSKILQDNNTVCGTKYYASPEMVNNEKNYTHKVDIWSAGVVCYAMLR